MQILDQAKINIVRRLPSLFGGRPPAKVSWASILFRTSGIELFTAAYKALAFVLLVWVVHRYWWAGMPSLSYLPAFGIILLARLAWPLSSSSEPPTAEPLDHSA